MKIEIRCDSCHRGLLVDEHATEALNCPACLTPIAQRSSAREDAPVTNEGAGLVGPESTSEIAVPTAPVARAAADESESAVVCPRCKLHFDPGGTLARRQLPTGPRQRILVIEDLEYFRQLANDALATHYEVVLAKNAAEAREALAARPVQLIVVDLDLEGGEDGRELLRSLQPKPCPILIFTAQDESEMYGEHWDRLRELGADDVVIKGMRVAESLERKARALLGAPIDEI